MAIVLLVLGLVSLIGVGMLTQSRMDVKYATSYKSHATAFNLADGAASMALTRVSFTMAPQYDGHAAPTLLNAKYTDLNMLGEVELPREPHLMTEERTGLLWFSKGPSLTQRRWPAGNWAKRDARSNVGLPRDPGNDVTTRASQQIGV